MVKNGSGKSTLLKILSGYLSPSKGVVKYFSDDLTPLDNIHKSIAFTAPYVELLEELTINEFLSFHLKFSNSNNLSADEMINIAKLENYRNEYIKNLSSGTKQKLKLSIVFLSEASILLLDEPTMNFDTKKY